VTFPSRSLCAATVTALALTGVLGLVGAADGRPFGAFEASTLAMFAGFSILGALLTRRRPDNRIGFVFAVTSAAYGLFVLANAYAEVGALAPNRWHGTAAAAALSGLLWFPVNTTTIVSVFLLFPDGRLPPSPWRWIAPTTGALVGLGMVAGLVGSVLVPVAFVGVMACGLASVASLVARYRRSASLERAQIRWFTIAALTAPIAVAAAQMGIPGGKAVACAALIGLPVSIGLAIFRYRLYDLDRVVRRTLAYSVLVATLAAVYLSAIALLGAASRALTGQTGSLAVTLSTLLVAAAFQPLRRRIQSAVDRRFARERYDAAQTLESFTGRLRDQVDLAALETDIVTVVSGTVQPGHVSLWLRPSRQEAS
jgi:hypothetical protein